MMITERRTWCMRTAWKMNRTRQPSRTQNCFHLQDRSYIQAQKPNPDIYTINLIIYKLYNSLSQNIMRSLRTQLRTISLLTTLELPFKLSQLFTCSAWQQRRLPGCWPPTLRECYSDHPDASALHRNFVSQPPHPQGY